MVSATFIPVFAAFSGSAAGMLATVLSNWVMQRKKQGLIRKARDHSQRHKLYKHFIREASKLFAEALVSEGPELSNLLKIYALIAEMRVVSSEIIVLEAEKIGRQILETYRSPNRETSEIPELMTDMDPLRHFSQLCRRELHFEPAAVAAPERSASPFAMTFAPLERMLARS